MKILSEMGERYWPDFKDDSANRRVITTNIDKDNGEFRQITVEPTALIIAFESVEGVHIESLDTNETLGTLFKGIQSVITTFGLNDIQRAGIRFSVLNSVGEKFQKLNTVFSKMYESQLQGIISDRLGSINDIGLAFDGESSDKLKYHCKLGPYSVSEAAKFFSATTATKMEENGSTANLIIDLDLFEEKFALTVNAHKWTKMPTRKANQLTSEIAAYVMQRI